LRKCENELTAAEVRTDDTIYGAKYQNLFDRIENYDEDEEIDDVIEPIIPMKFNGMTMTHGRIEDEDDRQ
jgi:hypothetical protein